MLLVLIMFANMLRMSTAYHPVTNGLDERLNQMLKVALRKVIDPTSQDDWNEHMTPII